MRGRPTKPVGPSRSAVSCNNAQVEISKLAESPAFVAVDLGTEIPATGAVRNARKILQDGAKTMARTITYGFACFEQQRGGLSAGISAEGPERIDAVAAFAAETTASVAAGTWSIDPAKGVSHEDLSVLASVDTRSSLHRTEVGGHRADDLMAARSVAQVVELTLAGDLDGRTVAAEIFDDASVLGVHEMCARGARVVSLSSEIGTVSLAGGVDPDALVEAWRTDGHECLKTLDLGEPTARNKVLGAKVDALCIGSKVGVLAHQGMPYMKAGTIVANGPVPITTKAFIMARDAGIVVAPDFVSNAGRLLSWHSDADDVESLASLNDAAIAAVWDEIKDHEEGPLMGACHRSEAFLKTWVEELPFGRPLA